MKTDDRATTSAVSISSVRARRLWSLRKPHLLRSFEIYGRHKISLAKKAGVAISTVKRMESFDGEVGARTDTLSLVQRALEKAGVEFLNHERPGVRMKAAR